MACLSVNKYCMAVYVKEGENLIRLDREMRMCGSWAPLLHGASIVCMCVCMCACEQSLGRWAHSPRTWHTNGGISFNSDGSSVIQNKKFVGAREVSVRHGRILVRSAGLRRRSERRACVTNHCVIRMCGVLVPFV